MAGTKGRPRAVTWKPAALPRPVTIGRGRQAVVIETRAVGRDLLITLTGGQAHAGAVAMGVPRQGAAGAGARLLVQPSHREGPLAREAARLLSAAAGCACVVVAGIHQDEATPQEIAAIVANARAGVAELALALAAVPPDQRYCSDRVPKPSTP